MVFGGSGHGRAGTSGGGARGRFPGAVRLAAAAVAALLVHGGACMSGGAGPPGVPARQGMIADRAVRESSGIVASRRQAGVYWTINDSGSPPVLYAMDATGKSLGSFRVAGARNVDWEDIAIDAGGKLYIADVGDNARARASLTIYVVDEPDVRKAGEVEVAAAVRFRYPPGHGPQDCETLFVRKGWAYLVSKELVRARLYRVRLKAGAEPATAEHLGAVPGAAWITAGDISPDGRHVALLSYSAVYVYDLPAALDAPAPTTRGATRPSAAIRVRPRRRGARLGQAEGICWIVAERPAELLITNEARAVYRATAAPAGSASAPAASGASG